MVGSGGLISGVLRGVGCCEATLHTCAVGLERRLQRRAHLIVGRVKDACQLEHSRVVEAGVRDGVPVVGTVGRAG